MGYKKVLGGPQKIFKAINICRVSQCANKLTNSEVENWFNLHSHMTVARLILI